MRNTTQRIRDLLARDLSEGIEEVVKVDQRQERVVRDELLEYVFTERIREDYAMLLGAIADGPSDPREDVGVWISGFFGSGKSSFAKNLGYILANDSVLGRSASELFLQQLQRQAPHDRLTREIRDRLNFVNARLQMHVAMFDVQKDRDVYGDSTLAQIMYSVLLRGLDYSTDEALAELEIGLEEERRLGEFVRLCAELYGDDVKSAPLGKDEPMPPTLADAVTPEAYGVWRRVRISAERRPRTVAILQRLDPQTYRDEASANALLDARPELTVRTLVDRSFELMARRRKGQALVYIIDEVGQYVARDRDRIENLRAIIEEFGQQGLNRVRAGQAPAPVWVMVTSQEKLNEVIAEIDAQRVELARLEDRFHYKIDMAPADIREVATKRVLTKTPEGAATLKDLFARHNGRLRTNTSLENTTRRQDVDAASFAQHYPYLPHLMDLSIDIVSGIRLHGGAPRHIGGSNRTLIKQAYEMLVGPRTHLADAEVGTLVTLDRVYDLVESNLGHEIHMDVAEVTRRWPDRPMYHKVIKAVALLENVTDLPRTARNLAALLHPHVSAESCLTEVEEACEALSKAQFIRQTEHGWKLQTHQEKEWTTERDEISPAPRDRNDILREAITKVLESEGVDRFRYRNLRTFRVGATWGNHRLTDGDDIPLALEVVDEPKRLAKAREQVRVQSRHPEHQNKLWWLMTLTSEVDDLVAEVHRSRVMIERYERDRAENKLTPEKAACLSDEHTREARLTDRLHEALRGRLAQGEGCFRGSTYAAADLGEGLGEALPALCRQVVPELYPKLEMAAYPIDGGLAERLLRATNLRGLPTILYAPPGEGPELIRSEGSQYVINTTAPAAAEVIAYLNEQIGYGKDVNGAMLGVRFGGLGYGWELDMVRLIMAALFRAGAVRVTYQGRTYEDYTKPESHKALSGTQAFRSSSFTLPKEPPDVQTQVKAAKAYENLTGHRVDVNIAAIGGHAKEWAHGEQDALVELQALAKANGLPISDRLDAYKAHLDRILQRGNDDVVRYLADQGDTIKQLRDETATIRAGTDEEGLARFHRMQRALNEAYPVLERDGKDAELAAKAKSIREALADDEFYQPNPAADRATKAIMDRFERGYRSLHEERKRAYQQAVAKVEATLAWKAVPEAKRASLIAGLRIGEHALAYDPERLTCLACGASMAALRGDLDALQKRLSDVLAAVQRAVQPDVKLERVSLARIAGLGGPISSQEGVDEAVERIRTYLTELVSNGIRVILE